MTETGVKMNAWVLDWTGYWIIGYWTIGWVIVVVVVWIF